MDPITRILAGKDTDKKIQGISDKIINPVDTKYPAEITALLGNDDDPSPSNISDLEVTADNEHYWCQSSQRGWKLEPTTLNTTGECRFYPDPNINYGAAGAITVLAYIDEPTNIDFFQLHLYTPEVDNWERSVLTNTSKGILQRDGELQKGWNLLRFNAGDGNNDNWGTLNFIRMRIRMVNELSFVTIGGIFAETKDKGQMMFVVDGARVSFMAYAYPKMKENNMPVTLAPSINSIGDHDIETDIVSVDGKTFEVEGDVTGSIGIGDDVYVLFSDQHTNDGIYTVDTLNYTSPNTEVTVLEEIPDATVENGWFHNADRFSLERYKKLRDKIGLAFSYHSRGQDVTGKTSDLNKEELIAETRSANQWMSEHGFWSSSFRFRAAWLQNNAPEHKHTRHLLDAYRSGEASVSDDTFPFMNNYDISFTSLHGRTNETITGWFETLENLRGFYLIYTHGIDEDYQYDTAPATFDHFISEVETGITEGWLEGVTIEELYQGRSEEEIFRALLKKTMQQ